jgi:hypothetical protein
MWAILTQECTAKISNNAVDTGDKSSDALVPNSLKNARVKGSFKHALSETIEAAREVSSETENNRKGYWLCTEPNSLYDAPIPAEMERSSARKTIQAECTSNGEAIAKTARS